MYNSKLIKLMTETKNTVRWNVCKFIQTLNKTSPVMYKLNFI